MDEEDTVVSAISKTGFAVGSAWLRAAARLDLL